MSASQAHQPKASPAALSHEPLDYAIATSSLGRVLVAWSATGVVSILIDDEIDPLVEDLQHRFPNASVREADYNCDVLLGKVLGHLEDSSNDLDVALDVRGTEFQRRVWSTLQAIPAGKTSTYTDVAVTLGQPSAARAVASACAANPIAVAIPCHRVVRNDGGLSGYRWGVQRKQALLARETTPPALIA